jgi:hypothetical protein
MSLREWYRETVREPLTHRSAHGMLRCSYCGEALCFPVSGLDLDRVAAAHYARAWRTHALITRVGATL